MARVIIIGLLLLACAVPIAVYVGREIAAARRYVSKLRRDPLAYSHGDVVGPPPTVIDFKCNTWPRCVQACGRCGDWS